MLDFLYQIDWAVLYFIQEYLVHPSLDGLMGFFTHLGDVGAVWLFISFVLLFSKKHRKLGILLLVGLLFQVLLGNVLLKPLVARPRPCFLDTSIALKLSLPEDFSFPSGHTFSSFLCASLIAQYDKKWGRLASLLAFLIAFSRLYFFVHFPSDILGGALLGIILAKVIYRIYL